MTNPRTAAIAPIPTVDWPHRKAYSGPTGARVWTPTGSPIGDALAHAHVIAIGAHADDTVVGFPHACDYAAHAVDVVLTNGAGNTLPAGVKSSAELIRIREEEEIEFGRRAGFSGVALLRFSSAEIQNSADPRPTEALMEMLAEARPKVVFTHSPFDGHPSHSAALVRVFNAYAGLPETCWPRQLLCGEVWHGLDWVPPQHLHRESVDLDPLGELIKIYSSQNQAQRYDVGLLGRWRGNASFADPHKTCIKDGVALYLDASALIGQPASALLSFVDEVFEQARSAQGNQLRKVMQ